jgi:hypothetical protein
VILLLLVSTDWVKYKGQLITSFAIEEIDLYVTFYIILYIAELLELRKYDTDDVIILYQCHIALTRMRSTDCEIQYSLNYMKQWW